jgi:hypothetical protein
MVSQFAAQPYARGLQFGVGKSCGWGQKTWMSHGVLVWPWPGRVVKPNQEQRSVTDAVQMPGVVVQQQQCNQHGAWLKEPRGVLIITVFPVDRSADRACRDG